MQMSGTLNQTYTNKSPPTPLVQTSLKQTILQYPLEEELELSEKRNTLQDVLTAGSSLSVDQVNDVTQ